MGECFGLIREQFRSKTFRMKQAYSTHLKIFESFKIEKQKVYEYNDVDMLIVRNKVMITNKVLSQTLIIIISIQKNIDKIT